MSDRFGADHDPQSRKADVGEVYDMTMQTVADEKADDGWNTRNKPTGDPMPATTSSTAEG